MHTRERDFDSLKNLEEALDMQNALKKLMKDDLVSFSQSFVLRIVYWNTIEKLLERFN
jgi:hypothetical protein